MIESIRKFFGFPKIEDPKPGEVWEMTLNNPWDTTSVFVLETKDGWLRYYYASNAEKYGVVSKQTQRVETFKNVFTKSQDDSHLKWRESNKVLFWS